MILRHSDLVPIVIEGRIKEKGPPGIPQVGMLNRVKDGSPPGGGYSHTLPIRVCAAQRGRDFEAPDLERGIHFRRVF